MCHVLDEAILGLPSKYDNTTKRAVSMDEWKFDLKNSPTTYGSSALDEDFVATMMFYLLGRYDEITQDRKTFIEYLIKRY